MSTLHKNQLVAKVINLAGYKSVAFNFKIYSTNPVVRITEYGGHEISCLEFDPRTGKEVNGMNCSYLISQEDAIKLVDSGALDLDGGEEEVYLDLCLEYWLSQSKEVI